MTNFERIQNMNRLQMAVLLCGANECGNCPFDRYCTKENNGAYVWLGQEAENE